MSLFPSFSTNEQLFSRSTPAQIQTFEEFQLSRKEKMDQVTNDINAKKEQMIRDMQEHLKDLMSELNRANSELAEEEREFLTKRENLLTKLKGIKAKADTQFVQARVEHLSRLDALKEEHHETIQQIQQSMEVINSQSLSAREDPQLEQVHTRAKAFESTLRQYQERSNLTLSDIDTSISDGNDALYLERIEELETQKQELIQSIKEEEQTNQNRIMELTMMLDDQDCQFQREIDVIQDQLNRREEQYKQQLEKLYCEIDKIRSKRETTLATKQQRIQSLQGQIDSVENEFREKLRDASRVAEELKTTLVNANLRKERQLETEKRRSEEQRQLMQESLNLRQQTFAMQKELQKAKDESTVLRRELSAKIGPRRTASLFL